MSIRRRLFIFLGVLFSLLLLGNLLLNIHNLQQHFSEQLQARAGETGTTLALALTTVADQKDRAAMQSMLDVVFDRGFYRHIRFDFVDGSVPLERTAAPDNEPYAPQWFKQVLPLPHAQSQTFVNQGWLQLGELTVVVHPGFIYRDLWRMVQAEFAWFAMMLVIALYGLRWVLHFAFKPLSGLTSLTRKIAEQDFSAAAPIHHVKELKPLTQALSQMQQRLALLFREQTSQLSRLQREIQTDALTELPNQNAWQLFYENLITEEGFMQGFVMEVSLLNLQDINLNQGKRAGDDAVKKLAQRIEICNSQIQMSAYICRYQGGSFLGFVAAHHLDENDMRAFLDTLAEPNVLAVAYPLAAPQPFDWIMAQLHCTKEEALRQHKRALLSVDNPLGSLLPADVPQRQVFLQNLLDQSALTLWQQPLFDRHKHILQREILCRLTINGQLLNAAEFWPQVKASSLTAAFDREVLSQWQTLGNKGDWVVNIAIESLQDADFIAWLTSWLAQHQCAEQLIFEMPETVWLNLSVAQRQIMRDLQKLGIRFGIDRAGFAQGGYEYLSELLPYHVKLDRRFARSIHERPESRFFVQALLSICHSQGIKCFAEGVELHAEYDVVCALGIDGVGGYYLAKPCELLL
jgi:EAL domain-containing protein (putative c-di-GMP-specific phosphodiesterase class I)/GGDEF domain-containing protein